MISSCCSLYLISMQEYVEYAINYISGITKRDVSVIAWSKVILIPNGPSNTGPPPAR